MNHVHLPYKEKQSFLQKQTLITFIEELFFISKKNNF